MKAGDVKRALANVPDDVEVQVGPDEIRLAPSGLIRTLAMHYTLKQFAKKDAEQFLARQAERDASLDGLPPPLRYMDGCCE